MADTLPAKWKQVAAHLLELASNQFSYHGCNDWNYPDDWTLDEKRALVQAMHEDNGSPGEYDPDHLDVPDWWVMSFLASRLLREEKV